MKKIAYLLVSILFVGPIIAQDKFETLVFKSINNHKSPVKKIKVYFDLKSDYDCEEITGTHFGEEGIEYKYHDGSKFFVSNMQYDGSLMNLENRIFSKMPRTAGVDTLISQGKQENGLSWKEVILNDVVVGYYDTTDKMIESFNRSILSVRLKRKKKLSR